MSLGHGPKIVTKGLAFAYDMGPNPGVNKSWKGQPVTNVVTNTNLNTGWSQGYNTDIVFNDYPPPNGINSQVVSFRDADGNGSGYWYSYGDYAPQSPSTTYAVSVYARTVGSGTFSIRPYTANNSETGRQNLNILTVPNDGKWHRLEFDIFTTPSNTQSDSLSFSFTSITANKRCWLCAPQMTATSYHVPFVAGTRSNTQALLDWTGNATITATSPTYNSDGSFTFNGGTERLDISNSIPISNNFSWSAWIRSNNISQTQNIVSMNGPYFMRISNSRVRFNILTSDGWLFQNGTTALSSDTWYNLCMVWNGAANTWTGYINGDQEFSVSKSGTVTYSSLYGYVGYTPQGGEQSYFNGDIPVLYCHAKALSAAEVQQNFQALRGRYGI